MKHIDKCSKLLNDDNKIELNTFDDIIEFVQNGELIFCGLQDGMFLVQLKENVDMIVVEFMENKSTHFSAESSKLISTLAPFMEHEWYSVPGKSLNIVRPV